MMEYWITEEARVNTETTSTVVSKSKNTDLGLVMRRQYIEGALSESTSAESILSMLAKKCSKKLFSSSILSPAAKLYDRLVSVINLAKDGHPGSLVALGDLLVRGKGVDRDIPGSIKLYQLAAAQNSGKAHNRLGRWFELGFGTSMNVTKAFQHYKASADVGNRVGQFNAGLCLWSGKGVCKDRKAAMELLSLSAHKNYPRAQFNLGCCLLAGTAAEKEYGLGWISRAAAKGFTPAQNKLDKLGAIKSSDSKERSALDKDHIFLSSKKMEGSLASVNHANLYCFDKKRKMPRKYGTRCSSATAITEIGNLKLEYELSNGEPVASAPVVVPRASPTPDDHVTTNGNSSPSPCAAGVEQASEKQTMYFADHDSRRERLMLDFHSISRADQLRMMNVLEATAKRMVYFMVLGGDDNPPTSSMLQEFKEISEVIEWMKQSLGEPSNGRVTPNASVVASDIEPTLSSLDSCGTERAIASDLQDTLSSSDSADIEIVTASGLGPTASILDSGYGVHGICTELKARPFPNAEPTVPEIKETEVIPLSKQSCSSIDAASETKIESHFSHPSRLSKSVMARAPFSVMEATRVKLVAYFSSLSENDRMIGWMEVESVLEQLQRKVSTSADVSDTVLAVLIELSEGLEEINNMFWQQADFKIRQLEDSKDSAALSASFGCASSELCSDGAAVDDCGVRGRFPSTPPVHFHMHEPANRSLRDREIAEAAFMMASRRGATKKEAYLDMFRSVCREDQLALLSNVEASIPELECKLGVAEEGGLAPEYVANGMKEVLELYEALEAVEEMKQHMLKSPTSLRPEACSSANESSGAAIAHTNEDSMIDTDGETLKQDLPSSLPGVLLDTDESKSGVSNHDGSENIGSDATNHDNEATAAEEIVDSTKDAVDDEGNCIRQLGRKRIAFRMSHSVMLRAPFTLEETSKELMASYFATLSEDDRSVCKRELKTSLEQLQHVVTTMGGDKENCQLLLVELSSGLEAIKCKFFESYALGNVALTTDFISHDTVKEPSLSPTSLCGTVTPPPSSSPMMAASTLSENHLGNTLVVRHEGMLRTYEDVMLTLRPGSLNKEKIMALFRSSSRVEQQLVWCQMRCAFCKFLLMLETNASYVPAPFQLQQMMELSEIVEEMKLHVVATSTLAEMKSAAVEFGLMGINMEIHNSNCTDVTDVTDTEKELTGSAFGEATTVSDASEVVGPNRPQCQDQQLISVLQRAPFSPKQATKDLLLSYFSTLTEEDRRIGTRELEMILDGLQRSVCALEGVLDRMRALEAVLSECLQEVNSVFHDDKEHHEAGANEDN